MSEPQHEVEVSVQTSLHEDTGRLEHAMLVKLDGKVIETIYFPSYEAALACANDCVAMLARYANRRH